MSLFKKAFVSSDRGLRDDPRLLKQKDSIKVDYQVQSMRYGFRNIPIFRFCSNIPKNFSLERAFY